MSKTHRNFVIGASVIFLIGCASPADLRQRKPTIELESNQPAKKVAICIADRWENSGIFGSSVPSNMRPTPEGYTLSCRDEFIGRTMLLVDVNDTSSGSITKYYKSAVLGAGSFDKAVQDCQ